MNYKHLLITVMVLLLFLPFRILGQGGNISVKGTIFDENHDPVPFASVVLKGTTSGVAADADGKYSISVPRNSVLIFSSIGYHNQEIPVNGRAEIDVFLIPDSEALEEVMVVAYGTATKTSFTGSAGKISGEKIQLIPNTNPLNTLNGTTPGIRLTSTLGQPGADATITIRGIGSINGNIDPLIVMDGIIYSGVLSSIPSGDIESITVLKDAASTALYGARAANGVIMVTTKQGKSEKATINVKVSTGWVTREFKDYETMGIKDYMETYWRLYYNNHILNGVTPEDAARRASNSVATSLNFTEEYNPWSCGITEVVDINGKYNSSATFKWLDDTDWRNGIEQVGLVQDYSVSANGRHGKNSYYASVGYSDNEGYIVGSGFERYTARANVSTKASDWLNIGVNMASTLSTQYGIQSTSQGTMGNVFMIARRMPPVYGVHLHDNTGAYILDEHGNPIYDFGEGYVSFPFLGQLAIRLLI
jgi:TonB-linked SusC/RagA family outer membrane protein